MTMLSLLPVRDEGRIGHTRRRWPQVSPVVLHPSLPYVKFRSLGRPGIEVLGEIESKFEYIDPDLTRVARHPACVPTEPLEHNLVLFKGRTAFDEDRKLEAAFGYMDRLRLYTVPVEVALTSRLFITDEMLTATELETVLIMHDPLDPLDWVMRWKPRSLSAFGIVEEAPRETIQLGFMRREDGTWWFQPFTLFAWQTLSRGKVGFLALQSSVNPDQAALFSL